MSAPLSRRQLRIGRSLAGLGLFARKPIKKGRYIARYSGRKLANDKADELNNKYLFELNNRWTIDGSSRRNLARYINHSCRPNAEVYFVRHVIKIRARRNIKAEEEITYNYGRDYLINVITRRGCKCDKCRKKRGDARAKARSPTSPAKPKKHGNKK